MNIKENIEPGHNSKEKLPERMFIVEERERADDQEATRGLTPGQVFDVRIKRAIQRVLEPEVCKLSVSLADEFGLSSKLIEPYLRDFADDKISMGWTTQHMKRGDPYPGYSEINQNMLNGVVKAAQELQLYFRGERSLEDKKYNLEKIEAEKKEELQRYRLKGWTGDIEAFHMTGREYPIFWAWKLGRQKRGINESDGERYRFIQPNVITRYGDKTLYLVCECGECTTEKPDSFPPPRPLGHEDNTLHGSHPDKLIAKTANKIVELNEEELDKSKN